MNVFGYIRVSGASQVEKDGPVRQELAIREFCKQNQLGEPIIFQERVSGTVDGLDRPKLMELLSEALKTGGGIVVVERLDRLARDLIVSELLMRELRGRDLALYATDQGLNDLATADADPSRKLIRQIFAAMAEYEKSALVLKLRCARDRAKRERAAKGMPETTTAYGRNRAEKIIIETVKNLRLAGSTWRTIATLLNQTKVPKRTGKAEWNVSEVYEAFGRHCPEKKD